jgi:hypothetical protein
MPPEGTASDGLPCSRCALRAPGPPASAGFARAGGPRWKLVVVCARCAAERGMGRHSAGGVRRATGEES